MSISKEAEQAIAVQRAMRHEAADYLKAHLPFLPQVVVQLGTGQGSFAERLEQRVAIPYAGIPHLKPSTAPYHAGQLVYGQAAGRPVLIMQGRLHLYEGYSLQEITFPIRVFHDLGVRILIACNGGGAVNPAYRQGDLMLIRDHINLLWGNPLVGPNDPELGPRFPDMTDAYSPRLRAIVRRIAANEGITLHEGVYVANIGPTYETPAETMMAYRLGGDLVGMSTVPEVIVARHMGMEVLGLSQVGNIAAGLNKGPLEKKDGAQIDRVQGNFAALLWQTLLEIL